MMGNKNANNGEITPLISYRYPATEFHRPRCQQWGDRWTREPAQIRCLLVEVSDVVPKYRLSLEVRQAILSYLRERLDARAVSVASIKKSIQKAVPRCDMTDSELTNMIAETAIEAGFGVNFDGNTH